MLAIFFPDGALAVPPVDLSVVVDGEGTAAATTSGPLAVTRVELSFDNGRPDVTVAAGGKVKARAVVKYAGNGILSWRWLVDGRLIRTGTTSLTYGDKVTIEAGELPPFPTFEPGTHSVTLQIVNPASSPQVPKIMYYVKNGDGIGEGSLKLILPVDSALLYAEEAAFLWNGLKQADRYRIVIAQGRKAVLRAETAEKSYRPNRVLLSRLKSGDYAWEVTALDAAGREAGRSLRRSFTVLSQASETLSGTSQAVSGLDFTGTPVGDIYGGLDFIGTVGGRFYGGLDFAGTLGGKFYGGIDFIGTPGGGFFGGLDFTGTPGGGFFGGLDFIGTPGGGFFGGLDFTGTPGGGFFGGLDFTGTPGGGFFGGLDFIGTPGGGFFGGLDFTGTPGGGFYGGLDFTGSISFGLGDISEADIMGKARGMGDIPIIDFLGSKQKMDDIPGVGFNGKRLVIDDVPAVDLSGRKNGIGDVTGIDFQSAPKK